MAMAMSHPTRIEILKSMNDPKRRLSPSLFAEEAGLPVEFCAYHFRKLAEAGCIALVDTTQRRGFTEHIYESLDSAYAWREEWSDLPKTLRHDVLKSVLGPGVHALGAAIDDRSFEAHDESHLSWNTIELDEPGWEAMSVILEQARDEVRRVRKEVRGRLADGRDSFLAYCLLTSFGSPQREGSLAGVGLDADFREPHPLRPTNDRLRERRRAARKGKPEREVMAKIMRHPTRVRILMAMNTPRRRMSPTTFAREAGVPVHHAAYHFGELEDTGCIVLVGTIQRRGVTEHVYEPKRTAIQWTDDWRLLGPAVKQTVLASVMRGGVEAIGAAVEAGTFEGRRGSHASLGTFRLDTPGWMEVAEIYDRTLVRLLRLDDEATSRIAAGASFFTASYFMASFEVSGRSRLPASTF
ncbi:MAG TPA: hypothetical protein VFU11_08685 [Solirubrobacterales bacterium]|nr:hypothetical protein [Solirubrobacterales bacterium]